MSKVIFIYNNTKTEIQCNQYESMKTICKKFIKQSKLNINQLSFTYNGIIINEALLFKKQISEKDKPKNSMEILVKNNGSFGSKDLKTTQNTQNNKNTQNINTPRIAYNRSEKNNNKNEISKNRNKIENCTTPQRPYSSMTTPNISRKTYNNRIENKNQEIKQNINNKINIYQTTTNKNEEKNTNYNNSNKNNINTNNTNFVGALKNKNYIIATFKIKKEDINKNIRIINSFEEFKEDVSDIKKENRIMLNNEKNIEEFCEIEIDNKVIPFSYFHKFDKEGEHKIKYSFKTNLKNNFCFFTNCKQLTSVDLSNFSTDKLNNINSMLTNYESLNGEEINEIKIQYKTKGDKKLKIFGYDFVKNNKNICKIIYENKEYDLCDYFNLKYNINGIIKINLVGIKNITNMGDMFYNCSSLISLSDISKLNTNNVKNMKYLFGGCSSLLSLPDISKWNTNNVIDMSDMFCDCSSLLSLPDISNWNTNNVKDMSGMFLGCSSLLSLPDISKWDMNNVTKMGGMFDGCSSLSSLPDISKWNTNNVTNMNGIFWGCSSLTSLPDISKWNTINVTDMSTMFCRCSSLISLPDISKWNTNNVKGMSYMFDECLSLVNLIKPDGNKILFS